MGRPKGLLPLDGVPLLRAHVDTFRAAGLPVTVVLGNAARAHIEALPAGVGVVLNLLWASTDMAESAALALHDAGDVLITPVDTPPARPDTLARLLATPAPAVPTWNDQPGHPIRLAAPHPRTRLEARLVGATRVPVDDPDCVRNLNRPEEWAAWLASRGGR
jgi:CTP:molybdopterin cytidylyltransferase MocA